MVLKSKTHLLSCIIFATLACFTPGASGHGISSPQLRDSVPQRWNYESDYSASLPSSDDWWQSFEDPLLTDLIRRGEERSLSLSATLHRIEMARQNWLTAKAAYFPSLEISAGWNAESESGMTSRSPGKAMNMCFFDLGLSFSWEIDLFGRVAANARGAKASLNVAKADYNASMITLSANIASAYFNYRLAQARIDVAGSQISSQKRIFEIAEARYDAGLVAKLDVAQARTMLFSTEATLPALESLKRASLNSLALLIGCYPEQLAILLETPQPLPNAFRIVNIGVPADLIRRRPDILEAEYKLAAYAADLGIAKKDFLPVLSINGSIGTSARRFDKLFSKESLTYSVAPTLSWTIFDGLSRKYRVASAKEQMLAGIDEYNLVVMNAVIETENALTSYDSSLQQISLFQKVLQASKEALELAVDRYKRGLAPFSDVMNAQISTLNYENTLLETRGAALNSLVKVYTAVAGSPENM